MGHDPGPFVMSMQPQPSGFRLAFHIKAAVVEVDTLVLTASAGQKVTRRYPARPLGHCQGRPS
jgi:hypothetical protein